MPATWPSPLSQTWQPLYSQPSSCKTGCTVAQPISVFQNQRVVCGVAFSDQAVCAACTTPPSRPCPTDLRDIRRPRKGHHRQCMLASAMPRNSSRRDPGRPQPIRAGNSPNQSGAVLVQRSCQKQPSAIRSLRCLRRKTILLANVMLLAVFFDFMLLHSWCISSLGFN